jgi:hypothetical protein
VELEKILVSSAPTDLSPEFVRPDAAAKMSRADRFLVVVLSRVLGPEGLKVYADLLENTPVEPSVAISMTYRPTPTKATRQDVAGRLVPHIRAINAHTPACPTLERTPPAGPASLTRLSRRRSRSCTTQRSSTCSAG